MIYFIEHDTQGNICHACADPNATIVPLINRVVFNKADGTPNKDADGKDLSPSGYPLAEPIGVDATTYNSLIADGINKYTCDPTTQVITKKAT